MQFTTSQVHAILNLPTQTMRYWRAVLEPLKNKPSGKIARFTVGEILALAVVSKLVTGMRIDVGAIAPLSTDLFELCRRPAFFVHTTLLCVNIAEAKASLIDDLQSTFTKTPLILLPIGEMAKELTKLLSESNESDFEQREFSWPLTSVR